jgi:DNA-binding HxlR family transcriptional regulator
MVNGSWNGGRPGVQTLLMLAMPLNVSLLRALAEGTGRQTDLRRAAGMPAQTTLRDHLRQLAGVGVIARHRRNAFPGALEFELTGAGRDLLEVMAALEAWLAAAPDGPLALGGAAAKAAIKALAESWSSTILRALAAGPLSLTELDRLIGALNYPSLERRLAAMRLAGQIEARPSDGRGTPYAITVWLRQGVAPIAGSIHWESRHLAGATPPLGQLDAEATFLLSAPLLRLPAEFAGSCRLAVEVSNGHKHSLAGVVVETNAGRVLSCTTQLQGCPDAWMSGTSAAWLAALTDADASGLQLGGDTGLGRALLDSLHRALFDFDAQCPRTVWPGADPDVSDG